MVSGNFQSSPAARSAPVHSAGSATGCMGCAGRRTGSLASTESSGMAKTFPSSGSGWNYVVFRGFRQPLAAGPIAAAARPGSAAGAEKGPDQSSLCGSDVVCAGAGSGADLTAVGAGAGLGADCIGVANGSVLTPSTGCVLTFWRDSMLIITF